MSETTIDEIVKSLQENEHNSLGEMSEATMAEIIKSLQEYEPTNFGETIEAGSFNLQNPNVS